ncbi:hypothetical protein CDAR_4741 [Caerostris darwini]|uniref:LAGLIDADG homing endonuclease n=1 Tax=Caerostris darwini TaxID=1538125 RepID=A0AAV4P6X1_9ARAC|nr:hypothetical protein CDAR_4741 [Caerostris darwini]
MYLEEKFLVCSEEKIPSAIHKNIFHKPQTMCILSSGDGRLLTRSEFNDLFSWFGGYRANILSIRSLIVSLLSIPRCVYMMKKLCEIIALLEKFLRKFISDRSTSADVRLGIKQIKRKLSIKQTNRASLKKAFPKVGVRTNPAVLMTDNHTSPPFLVRQTAAATPKASATNKEKKKNTNPS